MQASGSFSTDAKCQLELTDPTPQSQPFNVKTSTLNAPMIPFASSTRLRPGAPRGSSFSSVIQSARSATRQRARSQTTSLQHVRTSRSTAEIPASSSMRTTCRESARPATTPRPPRNAAGQAEQAARTTEQAARTAAGDRGVWAQAGARLGPLAGHTRAPAK
jgi:hypothetical protein